MTRISLEEAYDNKDVITQIVKLKDAVNEQAGGIIDTISITGNDLVIVWENGDTQTLPLPDPVTSISSVAGSVAGGNLTITFYFTNGTTHSFTTPLSGMASEDYVDTQNALNAKLAANNAFTGINTFSQSPVIPTEPDGNTSSVNKMYVNDSTGTYDNNIIHKDGNETKQGTFTIQAESTPVLYLKTMSYNSGTTPPVGNKNGYLGFTDSAGHNVCYMMSHMTPTNNERAWFASRVYDSEGAVKASCILELNANNSGTTNAAIINQRAFSSSNTDDIVTVGMLIEALQQYDLIQ